MNKYHVAKLSDNTVGNVDTYRVLVNNQEPWQGVQVWHDVVEDRVNCTRCSTILVAMSASCIHAKAVRRFLNKEKK